MATVAGRIKGVHKACSRVPGIGHRDFDELVDSIKAHGLMHPIEINRRKLLVDGRSRLQACAAAGIQLTDDNIVVTDADPVAIAGSNNARRHLTRDQKVMEAQRLLQEEEELAAQRKAEGGKKGRQAKQCSLGTTTVPSTIEQKKRQPRAKDRVAAATGVSRERLTVAGKIRKADPKIAEKVEQGALTLEDAAKKVGLVAKKRTKPIVVKPVKQGSLDNSVKGKPTGSQSLWKDEFTELIDTPNGLRTLRCPNATFYIDKTGAFAGFVIPEKDQWWYAGTNGPNDIASLREDAEKSLLECFSVFRKNEA